MTLKFQIILPLKYFIFTFGGGSLRDTDFVYRKHGLIVTNQQVNKG